MDKEQLRALRNSCAQDPQNSFRFIDDGSVVNVFSQFKYLATRRFQEIVENIDSNKTSDLHSENEDDENNEVNFQWITVASQFISNFAACKEENRIYLWNILGESKFQDAVAATAVLKNKKALGAIISSIFQCVHPEKSNEGIERMKKFLTWRALNCQIILSVADIQLSASGLSSPISTPNDVKKESQKDITDEANQWFHLLSYFVLKSGFGFEWFLLVSNRNNSASLWNNVLTNNSVSENPLKINEYDLSHEQYILLHYLLNVFEDHTIKFENYKCFKTLLSHIFILLQNNFDQILKLQDSISVEIDVVVQNKILELISKTKLFLEVCNAGLILMNEKNKRHDNFKDDFVCNNNTDENGKVSNGFIEVSVRALKTLNSSTSKSLENQKNKKVCGEENEIYDENKKEVIKLTLQLLSNLTFRNESIQNILRECDGLLVVLSLCATDVSQPLRREWAILCLRNSCEGNLANQKSIEELTLQGVNTVNNDLINSGIQVEFNQETGKIDFKQTTPSTPNQK